MPATTPEFISAMNGTTYSADAECAVTPDGINFLGDIINNRFAATLTGPFKFTQSAHALLSAPGAIMAAGGIGVTVSGQTYSVYLDDGYIKTQAASP